MSVNNYIRIGDHPGLTILTFDDKDPASVENIRVQVMELITGRRGTNIGMWKKCALSFPLVGEHSRSTSSYAMV